MLCKNINFGNMVMSETRLAYLKNIRLGNLFVEDYICNDNALL